MDCLLNVVMIYFRRDILSLRRWLSRSMAREDLIATDLVMTPALGENIKHIINRITARQHFLSIDITVSSATRRETLTACCTADTGTTTRRASYRSSTTQPTLSRDSTQRATMCQNLSINQYSFNIHSIII